MYHTIKRLGTLLLGTRSRSTSVKHDAYLTQWTVAKLPRAKAVRYEKITSLPMRAGNRVWHANFHSAGRWPCMYFTRPNNPYLGYEAPIALISAHRQLKTTRRADCTIRCPCRALWIKSTTSCLRLLCPWGILHVERANTGSRNAPVTSV